MSLSRSNALWVSSRSCSAAPSPSKINHECQALEQIQMLISLFYESVDVILPKMFNGRYFISLFSRSIEAHSSRENVEQGVLSSSTTTSKLIALLPLVYPLDVGCQISSVRSGPEVYANDVSISDEILLSD